MARHHREASAYVLSTLTVTAHVLYHEKECQGGIVSGIPSVIGLAWSYRVRRVNPFGSPPVFLQGWVEERGRHTRQSRLHLPPTTALTDLDAHITDVFPDVELATPGIDCLDKTHFPTHKWDPLMRFASYRRS